MANTRRLAKRIELITNISVIAAVLLFVFTVGFFILRNNFSTRTPPSSVPKGTKISFPSIDWSNSPQTLVLVLSVDCKYCTESTPFYRRLVSEVARTNNTQLVALFPQPTNQSREYLAKNDVKIDDIVQAKPILVGARVTPTLILVDGSGVVIQIVGRVVAVGRRR